MLLLLAPCGCRDEGCVPLFMFVAVFTVVVDIGVLSDESLEREWRVVNDPCKTWLKEGDRSIPQNVPFATSLMEDLAYHGLDAS